MHVLLTGAGGDVGSHVLLYLLREGWDITSSDLRPLGDNLQKAVRSLSDRSIESTTELKNLLPVEFPTKSTAAGHHNHILCDLCDHLAVEQLFMDTEKNGKIDGVIHFGAIPTPLQHDHRLVHNNNVAGSWNVLKTACDHEVKNIIQASSVNAMGLSYTDGIHQTFERLPLDETLEMRPVCHVIDIS